MDTSRLVPLREREYFVSGWGPDAWVPMRVIRRRLFTFPYTFAKNISGFDGAAASTWQALLGGATNMPVLQNAPSQSQVTNQLLNFQAIGGVTDALLASYDYEVLQIWYGIAPSVLRVWLLQPSSQYVGIMDQSLVPLGQNGQLIDVGFIDGFESPFDTPSQSTEFFSFKNVEPLFSVANPVPEQINPRLNFVINRMVLSPVSDPATIKGIFSGAVPAKWATIGEPRSYVDFPGSAYGGVEPLPMRTGEGSIADIRTLLEEAGYLNPIKPATTAAAGG